MDMKKHFFFISETWIMYHRFPVYPISFYVSNIIKTIKYFFHFFNFLGENKMIFLKTTNPNKKLNTIKTKTLRSQIRQDYPLNLSILISGGKETNKDSPSNCE